MRKIDLELIKKEALKEIEESSNLRELNRVFKKYLGRKGEISLVLKSLKEVPERKRRRIGKEANELKNFLKIKFDERAQKIREEIEVEKEWLDITVPGKKWVLGHLHPLTLVKREICLIFQGMGFEVVEGPEIEEEWYNFDALNIPKEHPARTTLALSLCRTFYLKRGKLLRSQTSPVQVRFMERQNPPLRIIVPGRCFRHEATDASHEVQLHQLEGLMVGKEISVANFKAIVQEFFKRFFQKPLKIRLRPDYFPFTEPSFDVAITCLVCGGKGCSTCQKTGWLEIAGAGMVHPNVFKNSGLSPKDWQGFAFGMGLDRLAMMKYRINDIRLFHSGDLRFLQQF